MIIVAMCVSCKTQRDVDDAESKRLTETNSVPTCEKCGMPMVAMRARVVGDKSR